MYGIAYGSYVISLDKASYCVLSKTVIVFYVSLMCSVMYLFQSIFTHSLTLPATASTWIFLILNSLLGMAAMLLLAEGVRYLGASQTAFINMLEPVTNIVLDFLFYGVIPSLLQGTACIMILGAISIIFAKPQSRQRLLDI